MPRIGRQGQGGAKVCEGGASLHPRGVQRGVQKWLFVRGSCGARNPKVSASICLPATSVKSRDIVNPCPGTLFTF